MSKSAEDNCVACHMPQSPTEIPHFAFTHHRIGLHDVDQPPVDKGIESLVPLVDLSHLPKIEQDRLLGLAYLQLSDTPGHTQGGVCFHLPAFGLLFAGDTLFAGSIGRTDLPGGDHATLIRSINDKLMPMTDETHVLPGHMGLTTIGTERNHNPFL